MSTDALKPIRLIKEGDGALMRFHLKAGSAASSISHVGTLHCNTCVGLYIPVSAESCYIAHINAVVFFKNEKGEIEFERERKCTASEGERIKAEVFKRLERLSKKHGWTAQDAYVQAHKAEVIMVCPTMKSEKVMRTGWYVAQALQELLSIEATAGTLDQGFWIEHMTGQTVYVPCFDKRPLSERGFTNPEEREPGIDGGEWWVAVEPDGWVK